MNEKIDAAIEKMAYQAGTSNDAQKALHFSQAALNLAHVKSTLMMIELEEKRIELEEKKQGAGA